MVCPRVALLISTPAFIKKKGTSSRLPQHNHGKYFAAVGRAKKQKTVGKMD
jgi:hypothetical protein